MNQIIEIKSISEAHSLMGIEKPKHPLISVFRHVPEMNTDYGDFRFTSDLYFISMKDGISGKFGYGRGSYDFEEGSMTFVAPRQVLKPTTMTIETDNHGWSMLFHPDLIRRTTLGENIDGYSFFGYEANEALHLSEKEKWSLIEIVGKIETEIGLNIDQHSQKLIATNLELLLDYCKRYYDRQFYTRSNINKDYVVKFEQYLKEYFESDRLIETGIPTMNQCGEALHMSGHYLSDLLKNETGKSAKEHIYLRLVEKAKNMLLNTNHAISKVAYDLGFDYPNHFSKLFKSKTGLSPSEYRNLN